MTWMTFSARTGWVGSRCRDRAVQRRALDLVPQVRRNALESRSRSTAMPLTRGYTGPARTVSPTSIKVSDVAEPTSPAGPSWPSRWPPTFWSQRRSALLHQRVSHQRSKLLIWRSGIRRYPTMIDTQAIKIKRGRPTDADQHFGTTPRPWLYPALLHVTGGDTRRHADASLRLSFRNGHRHDIVRALATRSSHQYT